MIMVSNKADTGKVLMDKVRTHLIKSKVLEYPEVVEPEEGEEEGKMMTTEEEESK
jgi:hypothetical protein